VTYQPSELANLTERELLLLTCQRVQDLHGRAEKQDERLDSLESGRDEIRGAIKAIRWLWAAGAAIAGLFGFHVANHK
jgi:hypothetical protein